MFRNFVIVTLRNLLKNRLYSIINISGLSIGILCSMLIMLWVQDELSYDQFIPKKNALHQVWVNAEFDGRINSWRSVPLPTYEAMKTADAGIVNSCVVGWGGERLLAVDDNRLLTRGHFVSDEFLEMFEFELLEGEAQQVLDDPSSIVLTESMGRTLFGDQDPMGKIVRVDDASELKVTGILKDIPTNSSFQFEYLIPWSHRESINRWVVDNKDNWGNYSFQVFVELNPKVNFKSVESEIAGMLMENGQDDIERAFFLYPLPRWRLYSNFENGKEAGGMIDYVQLFTIIAIFTLVIACINFMNLATARSEKRAKEVGIRKSIGSRRVQIMSQFMGESLVISTLAFVLAFVLAYAILPMYNQLVGKQLVIDFSSPEIWLYGGALILFTGLTAGSYPAFYLSSFTPATTLKGKVSVGKSASTPRKVLVILQFGFAILLMIGTVVIYQQIDMVKNRELGYNQENLITIPTTEDIDDNYETIKLELMQTGAIASMTRSNSAITQINSNNFLGWPGKPEDLRVLFTTIATEYDYAETMGVQMLMGRDFSRDFISDSSAIIVNKAALDLMQLEDPIGTQLDLWGNKRTLIGVIDNVIMQSPYREVKPLLMIMDPGWVNNITVRLRGNGPIQEELDVVKSVFEKHNPAYPFDYSFVDADFERKFTTINMTQRLAFIFSVLAIIITGLGLFGLAAYTAQQRTKEIGIRKVLGASVSSLVSLMSKDFSKLVVLSFMVSAPVAWYLLDNYLDRYQVRTDIAWWIFPLTGFVALTFALLIVVNQSLQAAQSNPVKSLRNE